MVPLGVAFGPETMPATFHAAVWHEYFMTVGGGAAALTGLVFVAMTLHLDEIINNPVHRHRARTILAGLTAVFIRCGLVLMGGQTDQAVAVEIIAVLVVVEAILYRSIKQAARDADNEVLLRALGSFACLVLEQVGAVILFLGASWGLYVVALGMMSSFIFMVTGAWLLLVGVGLREAAEARSAP
jgi:modulator of FtsH protease